MARSSAVLLRSLRGLLIAGVLTVGGVVFNSTAYADACGTEPHITSETIQTKTVNSWDPVNISFTWCAPDNVTSASFTAQIPTDLLNTWPSAFNLTDAGGAVIGSTTINSTGLMTFTLDPTWLAAHPLNKTGTATVGYKLTSAVKNGGVYPLTFPVSGGTAVTDTITVIADGPVTGDWYTGPSKYMNQNEPGSTTLNWGIYFRSNGATPVVFTENGGAGYTVPCDTDNLTLSIDDVAVPYTIVSTAPCTVSTDVVATGIQTFKLTGTGTITDASMRQFSNTATIAANGQPLVSVDAQYDMPTGSGTGTGNGETTPTIPPVTPPAEAPVAPTPVAELAKTGMSVLAVVAIGSILAAAGTGILRYRS